MSGTDCTILGDRFNGNNHSRMGRVRCRQNPGLCPKTLKLAITKAWMASRGHHFGQRKDGKAVDGLAGLNTAPCVKRFLGRCRLFRLHAFCAFLLGKSSFGFLFRRFCNFFRRSGSFLGQRLLRRLRAARAGYTVNGMNGVRRKRARHEFIK